MRHLVTGPKDSYFVLIKVYYIDLQETASIPKFAGPERSVFLTIFLNLNIYARKIPISRREDNWHHMS